MTFNETLKTLTDLERKVYVNVLEESMVEYCTSVKEISLQLELDIKTVRGVVGSLVKKMLVYAETEVRDGITFHDLFPFTPNASASYGNENLEEDEIEWVEQYIKENK